MQHELFYEDEYDALRACVQALGGAKKVGHMLYPDKSPDKAGEHLLNALNPNHAQKLSFSEGVFIMKKAREVGVHVAMYHIAKECNYTQPAPLEPEDQISDLQRQFNKSVELQSQIVKQLERLTK